MIRTAANGTRSVEIQIEFYCFNTNGLIYLSFFHYTSYFRNSMPPSKELIEKFLLLSAEAVTLNFSDRQLIISHIYHHKNEQRRY